MFTPGPGNYSVGDNKVSRFQNSPQWRIGTSKRDQEERLASHTSNFPSPDRYQPKDTYSSQRTSVHGWGFGSSKRQNLTDKKMNIPAPGQYLIPAKMGEGPRYHMGSKIEANSSIGTETRKTRGNPGPGAYKPSFSSVFKSEGNFTLKSRTKLS